MPVLRSNSGFFKQGTVSNSVLTLTTFGFSAAQVGEADRVIISTGSGALRLTWDQALTAPTTTLGVIVPTACYPHYIIEGRNNAARIQMIRDGSSDCTVNIMIESD